MTYVIAFLVLTGSGQVVHSFDLTPPGPPLTSETECNSWKKGMSVYWQEGLGDIVIATCRPSP